MDLYPIPTGYLFADNYENGELESLSIGDYGKENNIKADFLGYDSEIDGVPNQPCKPLTSKWVVTLSTQYGCPMNCSLCDVPDVDFQGNASFSDLEKQFKNAISLFSDQISYCERMNIHFARMGEPLFNLDNVAKFSLFLYKHKASIETSTGVSFEVIHPVISTCLPDDLNGVQEKLAKWTWIKNEVYNGQAGLQLSINSTDEEQRQEMFGGSVLTLEEIASIGEGLSRPTSRKYCLNFAYSTDYDIDADKLREMFNPEKFMVKITPIHNNKACKENDIETEKGYESYKPYRQVEQELKDAGFDVIVFVPSLDEEDGLVTCGNLLLSGSEPKSTDIIKIEGIDNATLPR